MPLNTNELRQFIKKIPVVGCLVRKTYRCLRGRQHFSSTYWEERYKKGGDSGDGSYDQLAEFKGVVINEFVAKHPIESVIEFGSGDGNQLKYFEFSSYVGYDVSKTAVSRCRKMYKADPSKQFKQLKHYANEKADLTLSLDVIYHLIEDEVYNDYMNKLFSASSKFVIIYSSNADEHENNGVSAHVKHRKFTDWTEKHADRFEMVEHIPNKFPFDGDGKTTSYADFYVFKQRNF